MRRHPPGWLAWPLAAVTLAVAGAGAVLVATWPGLAEATYADSAAEYIVDAFGMIGAPIVGAVLASRRPGLLYGWLLLSLGLTDAAGFATGLYGSLAMIVVPDTLPLGWVAAVLAGLLWLASIVHLPFLLLLFPDGRLPSPRWRWLVRIILGLGVLAFAFAPFLPGHMGVVPVENPLGASGTAGTMVTVAAFGAVGGLFACVIAAGISVLMRRKTAGSQERLQLKWFAYAAVVFGVLLAVNGVVAWAAGPLVNAVLGTLSLNAMFAAIGVAVLRYRLYEIDRIISRTIAYTLLSGVLAAVYIAAVLVLSRLLAPLGAGSELAVAAATLTAAALFTPARRNIQNVVDRRFNRARYDAQRTVQVFRTRLQDELDPDSLKTELVALVGATFAPHQVGVWIRSEAGGRA